MIANLICLQKQLYCIDSLKPLIKPENCGGKLALVCIAWITGVFFSSNNVFKLIMCISCEHKYAHAEQVIRPNKWKEKV